MRRCCLQEGRFSEQTPLYQETRTLRPAVSPSLSCGLDLKKCFTVLCYKSTIDLTTAALGWFINVHTHYLQTAIRMNLSYISGAEPPLTLFVLEKVIIVAFVPEVTRGDVGSANEDLPSWVWCILCCVTTWEFRRRILMQKPRNPRRPGPSMRRRAFGLTLSPVPEADLAANQRSSDATGADVCDCVKTKASSLPFFLKRTEKSSQFVTARTFSQECLTRPHMDAQITVTNSIWKPFLWWEPCISVWIILGTE